MSVPFVAIGPAADYPAEADVESGVEYDFGNLTGSFAGGSGDAQEDTSQEILAAVQAVQATVEALTTSQQEAF